MYIELGLKYWKYHKKRAFFILFSIFLSVSALVSAALLVRSNKLQWLEEELVACGDCDFEFYNVSDEGEKKLRSDEHFAQFGAVYRCGYAKGESGTNFEVGYIEDETAEEMLHLTPIMGRYPEKSGEICIDKLTLNTMGYPTQLNQKISLTCLNWEEKELQTVSFMVVGIIEQTVVDEYGYQYIARGYESIEVSTQESQKINCPFAYITHDKAEEVYKTGFQKILLANVAITDTFDDQDMKELLSEKYSQEDFVYDFTKINNRSWVAQLLLGFSSMDSFTVDGSTTWGYHAAESRIGTDSTKPDFYSAVLIPVFFILIVLVTFLSLYHAISMTFSDRIRQNGMFRCLGMSRRSCQRHLLMEMLVLLIPGILLGYGLGFLIYAIVQKVQKYIFGIHVVGVGDVSSYFRPYLEDVTADPVLFPLLAICIALIPAVIFPAIRSGRVSPVAACAVRNRLQNKQKRFQVLLYMNLLVVMMAAIFGYCYFSADNDNKNEQYQTQLTSTGVAEWDYFMEQQKTLTAMGWGDELRHDTGISKEDLELLRNSSIVEWSEATIINLSTKVAVKNTQENEVTMDTLAGTDITEVTFPIYEEEREIYDLRIKREMKHRGYEKNEKVYQVPSIGIEDESWDALEKYVIEGSINLDKIKAGTEVVLVVTDTEGCTYHAGDNLPLNDDVYPDNIDVSEEYRRGGEVDFLEPTYEATENNWPQYCYARRKQLENVTIGAIMVIDDEMDSQKYFFDNNDVFPWNVFVSDETFQSWELPDNRYSKLWVNCKEGADTTEFERIWYQVLFSSQLMQNYVAQDIRDRMEATNSSGMTLFFAMLFMITIVSVIGITNTFRMGIQLERKRFSMLRAIGEKKSRLLGKKWAINFLLILIGGILSLIPVYVFDRFARYAVDLREEAFLAGEGLSVEHWAYDFPAYFLMEYHPVSVAVVASIIVLMFSSFVIGLCMKKELNCSIAEGIRESE